MPSHVEKFTTLIPLQNNIIDEGAKLLALSVCNCAPLAYFDVSSNKIGDVGANLLALQLA